MKKIISLLLLCCPLMVFAQLEKGKSFLSGSIGFGGSGPKVDSLGTINRSSNVALSFGYLISDRWAIGISPSYSHQESHNSNFKNSYDNVAISPFVRRYLSISDKFFVYVDGGLTGGFSENKLRYTGSNPDNSKSRALSIFIQPGVMYFVTNKIALQADIANIHYGFGKDTTTGVKSRYYNASFYPSSLYFGATWYF